MITSAPMHVDPNDIIIIRATWDDLYMRDAKHMFDYLHELYPNNPCICLPDYVSLRSCSVEEAKQIRKELDKIINEQEKKNDY